MSARLPRGLAFALGLLLATALPVVGAGLRSQGASRCAFDGVRLASGDRAVLRFEGGRTEVLCSAGCLRRRLATLSAPPIEAFVRDETSGIVVDAATAWFVESAIVTNPANRNRLHAFAHEADARRHAAAHHGVVLKGPGLPGLRATTSLSGSRAAR